jgi:hypothetical protein
MQTLTCENSLSSNIVNDLPPQNLYKPLLPLDVDLLMYTYIILGGDNF